jgi:hypothetical protein
MPSKNSAPHPLGSSTHLGAWDRYRPHSCVVRGEHEMTEYIVDSVSSGTAKGHYIADAPQPTKEPETHYFKKPIEERLALRTGQRAAEGWRLVSTSAIQREGGYMVFLFFERETRAPLDEPQPRTPSPIQLGPDGGGGTEVTSARPTTGPTALPTARPTEPRGGVTERLRQLLGRDR